MSDVEEQRPVPNVHGEAKEFWEGCTRHELLLQRCRSCGRFQFYPRTICHTCWSEELEWAPGSGEGEVYTFTIVHRAPTPAFQQRVPYVVALIDLKEGVRMLSHVVGVPPEAVEIGMRVRVSFEDISEEVSLPVFQPA